MSTFNDDGLVMDRFAEIKTQLVADLQTAFGADIKTDPDSTLGQILDIFVASLADINELAEQIADSQNPKKATGVSLADLVKFNGIERNPATKSTTQLILRANAAGATVLAGSLVSKDNGEAIFATDTNVTLAPGTKGTVTTMSLVSTGAVTVPAGSRIGFTTGTDYYVTDADVVFTGAATKTVGATCGQYGNVPASIGDLTVILDPIANWSTVENLTAAVVGTGDGVVTATAVNEGAIDADAYTLSKIINPVFGWDQVLNTSSVSIGEDRETDPELRARREQAALIASPATSAAIYTALQEIDSVTDVIVHVNNDSVTDSDSVPPQHLWAVLIGGSNADIAEALFSTVSAGIGYYNSGGIDAVTYNYADPVSGRTYPIKFERPTEKDVYITVETTIETDVFPAAGDQQIKDALVAFGEANYTIGSDILQSRLYTPVNTIAGHNLQTIKLGFSSSPSSTNDLTVDVNEIGLITADNIVVTHV